MATHTRMGELLLEKGLITRSQLDRALESRSRSNMRFGEVLVVLGFAEESAITRCLAEQYGLPVADLSKVEPTAGALALVSGFFSLTRHFLPVEISDDALVGVISDPIDLRVSEQVTAATGLDLSLSLASPRSLSEKIAACYDHPWQRLAS